MYKMKFDVKVVKNCLKNYGRVFTVRSWAGCAQESIVEVEGIGICNKYRIEKISGIASIERYVKLSGFANVNDWWNAISKFGANEGYLFLVVKKELEADQEFKCPDCGEISRLWALREIGKCDNGFCQTEAKHFIKVKE